MSAPPLGELLRRRRWISSSQLETARQRQSQLGGRLGTALLELGQLAEPLLLEALSEQLNVPAADAEDLRKIRPEVIDELPAKAAIRCEAIPFRSTASRLDVAMLDVRDLTLHDELSFIAGKRVKVHVANEVRIVEALARYYGQQMPARFRNLLDRLNRRVAPIVRLASEEEKEDAGERRRTAPRRAASEGPPPGAAGPSEPAAERPWQIELSPSERAALERPPASPPPTETTSSQPDDALPPGRRGLEGARRPREVAESLLEELDGGFERLLLFSVRRGRVSGWHGRGRGVEPERLRGYHSDLTERSVFQEMERPGEPFIGVLAPLPAHLRLHQALGGAAAHECLVLPIRVRGRLAAVLYADCGDAGLSGVDVDEVAHLAASAGAALERCILRRKMGPSST
ncbi:MAG: hypothetical protein R3325_11850 [Thermoanaerobaculia bacterium]|nr:hypothetical protein [Thermoanaerobaculia bacterium]